IAVLLRKRALNSNWPSVIGTRKRRHWGRKGVVPELSATFVEFLTVTCCGQRRTRIVLAAKALKLIHASGAGDPESQLDRSIVGLHVRVGDRPVHERCV